MASSPPDPATGFLGALGHAIELTFFLSSPSWGWQQPPFSQHPYEGEIMKASKQLYDSGHRKPKYLCCCFPHEMLKGIIKLPKISLAHLRLEDYF